MDFTVISSAFDTPENLKGGAVAIGNFDGVHRGHRAVLDHALSLADQNKTPAAVLTFEPHPRTFFKPGEPVFRLTPAKAKSEILKGLGFDLVIEHPFNSDISAMSPDDFIEQILVASLGASHVVTGYDFHFGKARAGTPDFLKAAGKKAGFDVDLVDAFSDENDEVVSSTRIRKALAQGDLALANGLLGYVWRVKGTVEKGRQVGRELGYPTANIALPPETTLKHGIYAVRVRRPDGSMHDGVASYGRRPTFDNGAALFETYLIDFKGDLYGEEHSVFLHGYLRGEEKFDDVEALISQMDRDTEEARSMLSAIPPDHGLLPVFARAAQ